MLFMFTVTKHNGGFIYGFHFYKYFNISAEHSKTHHLYKWQTLCVYHCPCYDQFHDCVIKSTTHVKYNTQETVTKQAVRKLLNY